MRQSFFFFSRQHRCHVRSRCRRRPRHDSARAHGLACSVSPRRIARPAIGKKAGFPIEFIRLTSVDSLEPTMARTNGASRRRRVVATNERIPLRCGKCSESTVTTLPRSLCFTFVLPFTFTFTFTYLLGGLKDLFKK